MQAPGEIFSREMGKGQKAAPGACKCPRVYTIMDRIPVLWEGRRPDMQKTEMKHLFSAAADYMDSQVTVCGWVNDGSPRMHPMTVAASSFP